MNWITFSEAETYFIGRPFSNDWEETSNDLKIKCLDWAELLLDSAFDWSEKAFSTNDHGEIIVNAKIKNAICEQALWLIQYNANYACSQIARDLESLSINGINAKFSSKTGVSSSHEILSPNCILFLKNLGVLRKENNENGKILSTLLEI